MHGTAKDKAGGLRGLLVPLRSGSGLRKRNSKIIN